MPSIDVDAARAATPGVAGGAYLNNAGSALPTQRTLDATIDHLRLEATIGGYRAHDEVRPTLDRAKAIAARLLNANGPDEIALVPSDTAAFVKVFWGLVLGEQIVPGDRLVVDRISYTSHYLALLQARDRFDLRIDVLPSRPDGSIDTACIDECLDEDVAMVTATMVGTHCGLVNPVIEVGAACRQRGVLYLLDACQAVGQLPVDVAAIGCDALTTTGRKWLRAPRGTGLLWVHRDVIAECEPIGIDSDAATWQGEDAYTLVADATRFQEFEQSIAGLVGLTAALEQLDELGIEPVHRRVMALADGLRTELSTRRVTLHDGDGERSGIVTFSVDGHDAAEVVETAAGAGVAINVSSAPWAPLDMAAKGLATVVRASPHYYNSDGDLARLLAVVDALVPR